MSGSDTMKRFLLQFCFALQITSTLGGIQKKKQKTKNKTKQNNNNKKKTPPHARLR